MLQKKQQAETAIDWVTHWGYCLVYVLTQSFELSENLSTDVLAAFLTQIERGGEREKVSEKSVQFAKLLFEASAPYFFRGMSTDSFYKLSPVTRAIVILKMNARFSLRQISTIVAVSAHEVEKHLENARLTFSNGKTWLDSKENSGEDCPSWESGLLFARYLENDLPVEKVRVLHSHFVSCSRCRNALVYFKNQYNSWAQNLPLLDLDQASLKQFTDTAMRASRLKGAAKPRVYLSSPWPGLAKLAQDSQLRSGFLLLMIGFLLKKIIWG